ncbi:MAG: Crp/Fnr family transcriptional regulator [bacterium]|nr:Crp/Fnr family transcriptional regulator [bacterium]
MKSFKKIFEKGVCYELDKNKIVFKAGDTPKKIYYVVEGAIKIVKEYNGKMVAVRFSKEDSLLGYRSALSGENYKATAITLEKSKICELKIDDFLKKVAKDKLLLFLLTRKLAKELGEAEEKLLEFTIKDRHSITASAILYFCNTYGEEFTIDRHTLQEFTGLSYETAIRALRRFYKNGIVDIKGRRIRVIDREKLESLAVI